MNTVKKTFKSQQGLAFHVKVVHSISKEDRKTPEPRVPESNEELIYLSVKDVVENLVNNNMFLVQGCK